MIGNGKLLGEWFPTVSSRKLGGDLVRRPSTQGIYHHSSLFTTMLARRPQLSRAYSVASTSTSTSSTTAPRRRARDRDVNVEHVDLVAPYASTRLF